MICGVCHPWSGHLYERLGTALTLTNDFCNEFYAECSGPLGLAADYCDVHTGGDGNQYYSYPLVIDGEKGRYVWGMLCRGVPVHSVCNAKTTEWWTGHNSASAHVYSSYLFPPQTVTTSRYLLFPEVPTLVVSVCPEGGAGRVAGCIDWERKNTASHAKIVSIAPALEHKDDFVSA